MSEKYYKKELVAPQDFHKQRIVTTEVLASALGSGRANVFSTPMMIALMEATCNEGVMPYLNDDYISVGTEVCIKHVKASKLGAVIQCQGTLVSMDGPFLNFEVAAYDQVGLIGHGKHQRCIVHLKKFETKTNEE